MVKAIFNALFKAVLSALILLALGAATHWLFDAVLGQPELAKAMLGVCVILAGGFAAYYLVKPLVRGTLRKLGSLRLKRTPAEG